MTRAKRSEDALLGGEIPVAGQDLPVTTLARSAPS
jgi:hypothetical protein